MTYKEYLCLYYNGLRSEDFGVKSVSVGQGMYSEQFLPNASIITESVRGRTKPYLIDVDRDVISLEINLAFYDNWDSILDSGKATSGNNTSLTQSTKSWTVNEFQGKEIKITKGTGIGQRRVVVSNTETAIAVSQWTINPDTTSEYEISYRRDVKSWLLQDVHRAMYFEGNENKIYYCMYSGEPSIVHNGAKQGYINGLSFQCNDSYAYMAIKTAEELLITAGPVCGEVTIGEFTVASDIKTLIIENSGDAEIFPEIWIEKTYIVGTTGNVSIRNTSDSNRTMSFTSLATGETVYINNENQIIETDIPGTFRYANHNNVFLRILPGRNNFTKVGDFDVVMRYQEKIL